MEIVFLTIGIFALIFASVPLWFSRQFNIFTKKYYHNKQPDEYAPNASLIIPCKGIDPGFRENIGSLFTQNYSEYEILFITATEDDPAVPVLKKLIAENPETEAMLYISGIVPGRSQKINNQICGIEHVSQNSEVLVFIDSDARPNPDFLSNLISPLNNEDIGMTTGFRWYLPQKGFSLSYDPPGMVVASSFYPITSLIMPGAVPWPCEKRLFQMRCTFLLANSPIR